MANPVGRPTLYKKEYCEMIIEHFKVQPQITKSKKTYFADGQLKSEEEYPVGAEFPTFQSFADKINVTVSTLWEWDKEYEEFSKAYAHAKELQEHIWLVNSMSNLYNAQFAQFFGKNCLGYKDKTEVDLGNKDGQPFELRAISNQDLDKQLEVEIEAEVTARVARLMIK